jgi:demethylmenaquinone methyltransferase/2-methoxy-6-polyprenyl-1,4-benzoquinol methylase
MASSQIPRMFSRIAHRYDLANHVLSLTVDRGWRRKLVRRAAPRPGERALDICTGTGDLLFEFARYEPALSLCGVDLSRGMLTVARQKHLRRNGALSPAVLRLIEGDALKLPFRAESFDIVSIAFGLRNLPQREDGLREMARVLRPGGRLLVLEFSLPASPLLRGPYLLYLHHVVPRIGGVLTGDRPAYEYLFRSISEYPAPEEIAQDMEAAGLNSVRWERLTGGIACLHVGRR